MVSMVLAVIGGLALAALRTSRLHWVRTLGFVLVQVLRGIALYVLVLWLFNGLAVATGITLTPIETGVVALSLLNSAYLAEVFRGAGPGDPDRAVRGGTGDRSRRRPGRRAWCWCHR